jgi:hypothetical protein
MTSEELYKAWEEQAKKRREQALAEAKRERLRQQIKIKAFSNHIAPALTKFGLTITLDTMTWEGSAWENYSALDGKFVMNVDKNLKWVFKVKALRPEAVRMHTYDVAAVLYDNHKLSDCFELRISEDILFNTCEVIRMKEFKKNECTTEKL